ncbi:hypothetical protein BHM03_00019397 [Ensete ventricosum]|nr:hypothetical protein BHM03_00019397 [Ensete ventricosum]
MRYLKQGSFGQVAAWDYKITMHHRPNTTMDVGLQEHGVPSTGTTRKSHEELQIRTRSHRVSALRKRLTERGWVRQARTIAAAISSAQIQEERLNQDARRMKTTPRPTAYKPPSIPNHPSLPKKLTKEELRDRSAKGLYWLCDELWSRDHRCKKGCLLLIEPIEDIEEEVQEHEEEVTDEEQQLLDITMHALTGYANPQMMKVGGLLKQQPITILINTGSISNFINSKVAIHMALPIEDCMFDVKFTDGRILKCDRRCPRVKLMLQDQEIIAYFFLPLDDCEAVLGIEWLMTLGDVS